MMTGGDLLTGGLILVGAAVMFAAILRTSRILPLLEGRKYLRHWRTLLAMMIVFCLSYLGAVALVAGGLRDAILVLTGFVFAGGAVFVALVTHVGFLTIDELQAMAHQLEQENARLAVEIAERQKAQEQIRVQNDDLTRINEELVAARDQANEATRLKSEFLSVMSHELRTPLNAIIGFQGILLMSGNLSDQAAHMVRRTQANADRLLNLINAILDISRIEAGRLNLTPVDLSIAGMVEKWRTQMEGLAEQKDLKLTIDVDAGMPEIIHADEDAVDKIVTNLLSNALKFTERGEVRVRIQRDATHWTVVVTDTGIGIPAHLQQVIFEEFRQVDGSTRRQFGGSGLGLAIVQKLCNAMNGTITVRSAPGEGSAFTVTLPLVLPVDTPAPALAP